MIAFLTGKLVKKTPDNAVIDVSGVGYAVSTPLSTYERLGSVGDEVQVFTHMNVRENAIKLYGFSTERELRFFERLIEVNGVGPKLALGILSGLDVDAFYAAIMAGDVNALSKAPGVGKKIAARLIMELQEPFRSEELFKGVVDGTAAITTEAKTEAIQALISLGLNPPDASSRVKKARETLGDEVPTEQLVREVLRQL